MDHDHDPARLVRRLLDAREQEAASALLIHATRRGDILLEAAARLGMGEEHLLRWSTLRRWIDERATRDNISPRSADDLARLLKNYDVTTRAPARAWLRRAMQGQPSPLLRLCNDIVLPSDASAAELHQLLQSRDLINVHHLDLTQIQVRDAEIYDRLIEAPWLPGVRRLLLGHQAHGAGSPMGDWRACALINAIHDQGLCALDLRHHSLSDTTLQAIAEAEACRTLTRLHLEGNFFGAAGLQALGGASFFESLERLSLPPSTTIPFGSARRKLVFIGAAMQTPSGVAETYHFYDGLYPEMIAIVEALSGAHMMSQGARFILNMFGSNSQWRCRLGQLRRITPPLHRAMLGSNADMAAWFVTQGLPIAVNAQADLLLAAIHDDAASPSARRACIRTLGALPLSRTSMQARARDALDLFDEC